MVCLRVEGGGLLMIDRGGVHRLHHFKLGASTLLAVESQLLFRGKRLHLFSLANDYR